MMVHMLGSKQVTTHVTQMPRSNMSHALTVGFTRSSLGTVMLTQGRLYTKIHGSTCTVCVSLCSLLGLAEWPYRVDQATSKLHL